MRNNAPQFQVHLVRIALLFVVCYLLPVNVTACAVIGAATKTWRGVVVWSCGVES